MLTKRLMRICRLLRISGHEVADSGKDPMLLGQFLVGLPLQYASQLRLSMAVSLEGLTFEAVANQARALCASGLVQSGMVAAAATSQVCFFNFVKRWDICGKIARRGRRRSSSSDVFIARSRDTSNETARRPDHVWQTAPMLLSFLLLLLAPRTSVLRRQRSLAFPYPGLGYMPTSVQSV